MFDSSSLVLFFSDPFWFFGLWLFCVLLFYCFVNIVKFSLDEYWCHILHSIYSHILGYLYILFLLFQLLQKSVPLVSLLLLVIQFIAVESHLLWFSHIPNWFCPINFELVGGKGALGWTGCLESVSVNNATLDASDQTVIEILVVETVRVQFTCSM